MTHSTTYRIVMRLMGLRLIVFSLCFTSFVFATDEPLAANLSADAHIVSDVSLDQAKGSVSGAAAPVDDKPVVLSGAANVAAIEKTEQRIIERSSAVGEQKRLASPPRNDKASSFSGWRTILALIAVLGLIGLATLGARRLLLKSRKIGGGKLVDVIARTTIGSRQSLCLVRLADRLLLVGLSPNHMAALDVIDDPETVARLMGDVARQSSDSISAGFGNIFQQESQQFNLTDNEPVADETYAKDANPSLMADSGWRRARGELSGLLNKVKGLSRLHWH
ncbi:MAG: FliO/MopB family protein [Sedimentisphaerales bacterium]|nr:FliO/MopB family protein [Sedimentisphaerales bacterium]